MATAPQLREGAAATPQMQGFRSLSPPVVGNYRRHDSGIGGTALDYLLQTERTRGLGYSLMRHEYRSVAQAGKTMLVEQTDQMPQAFARGNDDRVESASVPERLQRCRVRWRAAPVAGNRVDLCATLAQGVGQQFTPSVPT